MGTPKIKMEWKFNPSSLLTIIVALVALVALFVRAEGRIDGNTEHLEEHTKLIDKVSASLEEAARHTAESVATVAAAQAQSETNTAVLMQWQREQDRRIENLERESGVGWYE